MRLRGGNLLLALALGTLAASLPGIVGPTLAGSETTPTVMALAPYSWSPNQQRVTADGAVQFENASTTITHGIVWTGGTAGATPACNTNVGDDIPIGVGNWSTSWQGSCTFSKAGTYTYECSFHMALMRGTITATVPGAPSASTGGATGVGETAATLNGTVDPEGKATTYFFNYGTSTSYGSKTSEGSAGAESKERPVSLPIAALEPGRSYHFQLVAQNAAASTPGEDRTFTTASPTQPVVPPPPLPPPTPTPTPPPVPPITTTTPISNPTQLPPTTLPTSQTPAPVIAPVSPVATAPRATTPAPRAKTAAQVRAEKLARALRLCRQGRTRSRRAGCEKAARRRFASVRRKRTT